MKAHVNLLVPDLFGEDRFPFQKVALPGAFLALFLATLIGIVIEKQRAKSLREEIRGLNTRHAQATQSLSGLQAQAEEVLRQARTTTDTDEARGHLLKQLDRERAPWSGVMREISLLIPDQVWLKGMEGMAHAEKAGPLGKAQPGLEVRFTGFAYSHHAVTQWIAALERSSYFKHIQLVYAGQEFTESEHRVTFEIKAVLK